ncbi:AsmA family protein [Flavobacterium johnsoniae]|uniref:AsmA family protein n=1 Tax=Flavobacterium johnsoniae (strain ATCC 17061 / DSM 2064 / JCM 8514 / BCRC 14874 / CCUG 350202 / NBRC 14942 / NCIMB 11054 / UW101) TaxID=376686 RepID=A5FBT6_FLAJ1|nr:AsmA family protein [Flavobacterium johnsoniae]ABQ07325.1 AsmA family protein [Flavobacterium johnsoniae UW101]OXE95154.1 membrane assembly protein AsmA [Flavobacterium johnsoniae UW101]WQG80841.1 AsmA family protein [Flavobacterium johnsoniae UW101]SHL16465.1 AsmA protein [Flavobacterium johnsoniae]
MKTSYKNISLKILKWTGIVIAGILLLLFLIPLLFPGKVASEVKKIANERLDTKLEFSKSKLSFFTHFPSLTVSLDDISMTGSKPFGNDTLLKADQVAFGINLKRLIFDSEVKINKLYVSNALINVMVNEKGQANYNIYVAPEDRKNEKEDPNAPEEGTAIKLERIDLENCHVKYNDRSAKVLVDAKGFNYIGKGNLSDDIFDLNTDAKIDTLDFYYNRTAYLRKKAVRADLITRINTHALSFILQKNELQINKLPLKFTGLFTILRDGYKINIKAASENTTVKDLLSVMPPEYLTWLEKTEISGKSDLVLSFKGDYNVSKKQKPNLAFNLKIKDGAVSYQNAPVPLTDFQMDLNAMLPSLDTEQLLVNLRTLRFKVGEKDYFNAYLHSKGLSEMNVDASIKGALDLAVVDAAIGLEKIDLKGILKTNIQAKGLFSTSKKLFPKTIGGISLRNGWLKTDYYPNPIKDITFVANVLNKAGTYEDLIVAVSPASFVFEGNPMYVNMALSDFSDLAYNAKIKGELNVGRIYQVFSQKGLDVTGYAKADLSLKGKQSYATTGQYSKLDNRGTILLKNIKATSELFPKAFFIKQGNFRFQNEKMWFEKFYASYGKSDFDINGYLLNTINYFLESHGTLSGDFNMKSKLINVDEFMALEKGENKDRKLEVDYAKEDHPKMSGVVMIPKNLNVSLTANADKVEYNGLNLNKLSGKVGITKGSFYLENTSLNIIDCILGVNAAYKDESPTSAHFDAHFTAKDFSVQRAYKEIPMFHDMVTVAEKAQGIISVDYKIKGDLNGNMGPIYESLEGGGTINLRDVKIKGLKLFEGVSSQTGQKGLDDPKMEGIEIKSNINNNLISIEPFTFSVASFRPTIKGTTSFDGLLDLRMRLGLPPGGIIGFPIVITGTHENPKIKIFSKTGQKIIGAVYDEKNNKVVKKEKVSKKKS